MVTIITGKINSGKSTTIKKLYQKQLKGDGFYSKKIMIDDKVHSYNIVLLSDNSEKLFVIRDEFYNVGKIACEVGPYLFFKDTLTYIENTITKLIETNNTPIYLDEIGQLELYDQCFHDIFKYALSKNVDCVITVRKDLVDKVIRKYKIKDFNIKEV